MFVVGNHPQLVDALVDLVSDEPDLELLGVAGNSEEVLALVQAPRAPDVLLFDLESADCNDTSVVKDLSRRLPSTRLVALSNYDDIGAVRQAFEAGFHRHVSKRFVDKNLAEILKEEHANLG